MAPLGRCLAIFLGAAAIGAAAPDGPKTRPADQAVEAISGAKGLESAFSRLNAPLRKSEPLAAAEAVGHFKARDGLTVDLIASEPAIRQPLCINFDERGRMWVVQYIQYPFPAGLKVVEYDQYLRAKFDKTPLPPPQGTRGQDVITVLEDVKHDGSFSSATTFVGGLSIATSALPGAGGVWVMNPPYLLFYPTKDGGTTPTADPVVHLSGFGLEDTHAVANNLTWGPDGWLYGAQGSTCTAKVRTELGDTSKTTDFLGQAIWRYHPVTHAFEVFAEGGGNTFGLSFDDKGRIFSGTNWGKYLGMHYVQGGRGIKGWGKHGPLMNPYSFGFFEHMPHTGLAERLVHAFEIYGGGLLGGDYDGKAIGVNPLQSRLQLTRIEPLGSTFATVEEPFLVTTDDGWFRPVGIKAGPDGAVYVADLYERRISHVDPRDNWNRTTGRIYRVRPVAWKPGLPGFDYAREASAELVKQLTSSNRWVRATSRRVLGERNDPSVLPALREMLAHGTGQAALEALWALHVVGGLDAGTSLEAMGHADPYVRMWAVRLLTDGRGAIAPEHLRKLTEMAGVEQNVEVRSQLASSILRLPGSQAMAVFPQLLEHAGDERDPQIPLLLWWALEDKAVSDRPAVVGMLCSAARWKLPLVRGTIARRLAHRYAAEPTPANQQALVDLLAAAPGPEERRILVEGINDAFEGGAVAELAPALSAALAAAGNTEAALRAGDRATHERVLKAVADDADERQTATRTRHIELLGQVGRPEAAAVLVGVARTSRSPAVRKAALSALARFDDPTIGRQVVELYPSLPPDPGVRATAVSVLSTRPAWAEALLKGIESGAVPRTELTPDQVDRLRRFEDEGVAITARRVFGGRARPTPQEKVREIDRLKTVLAAGGGDATAGKVLFTARCAACHTLHGEGGHVGPDLTPYKRDASNLDFLVTSIVDPSAYIREEYTAFLVETTDGQTLVGVITERAAGHVTLVDTSQRKTVVPLARVKRERAMPVSLMPEELLSGMNEQETRDFFAYVQK